jgi:Ankyrin repeats (3 copies)
MEMGTNKNVNVQQLARDTSRSVKDIEKLLDWNFTETDIRGLHIHDLNDPLLDDWATQALYRGSQSNFRGGEAKFLYLLHPDNEDTLRATEADWLILLPYLAQSDPEGLNDNDIRIYSVFGRFMTAQSGRLWPRAAAMLIGLPNWNPNIANKDSNDMSTPLHMSVVRRNRLRGGPGYPQLIALLFERSELDPNPIDADGFTPLHHAVLLGLEDIVALLLAHPKIDVTQQVQSTYSANKDYVGKTALQLTEYIKDQEIKERIQAMLTARIQQKEKEISLDLQTSLKAAIATVSSDFKPFVIPGIPADIINRYREQHAREANRPSWEKPFAWVYKNPVSAGLLAVIGGLLYYIVTPKSAPINDLTPDGEKLLKEKCLTLSEDITTIVRDDLEKNPSLKKRIWSVFLKMIH